MNGARGQKAKHQSGMWAAAALVVMGSGWTLWQSSGVGAQPAPHPLSTPTAQAEGITLQETPLARNRGVGIKGDLFDNPLATPVQKGKPAPPAPLVVPPAPPVQTPPAPDPLADYAYMGTVALNGERFALLEHRKTHEGIYLKVGDAFNGYTAGRFDAQGLTFDSPAGARTLAMNDDFDFTPLNRDADYLGGRTTTHNHTDKAGQDKQEIASLTNDVYRAHFLNTGKLLTYGISNSANMEQMKNDVFKGKMTQEEFDRQTSGTVNTTGLLSHLSFQTSDDLILNTNTIRAYRPNE